MKRVAIIGGGLAGIAAAMRLIDHDIQPILIESKKRLGGRASSLVDPRSGHVIDNCQHVLLGCCTNLIDLYSRMGVLDQIEWHRTLYWTSGQGEIDRIRAGPAASAVSSHAIIWPHEAPDQRRKANDRPSHVAHDSLGKQRSAGMEEPNL